MIQIIDCEQGSPEWFQARLGLPTASEFKTVLAQGKASESKTRRTYVYKLAGEIITGEPMEGFSNANMERGKAMEPEARAYYQMRTGNEIMRVGFIRNGNAGCSPDALVPNIFGKGALEIKTAFPHILGDILLRNEFPPEHKAQCQGALWIAERDWIDLVIYWPRMPTFVKRAYRDENYIKHLAEQVEVFNDDLAHIVARLRGIQ